MPYIKGYKHSCHSEVSSRPCTLQEGLCNGVRPNAASHLCSPIKLCWHSRNSSRILWWTLKWYLPSMNINNWELSTIRSILLCPSIIGAKYVGEMMWALLWTIGIEILTSALPFSVWDLLFALDQLCCLHALSIDAKHILRSPQIELLEIPDVITWRCTPNGLSLLDPLQPRVAIPEVLHFLSFWELVFDPRILLGFGLGLNVLGAVSSHAASPTLVPWRKCLLSWKRPDNMTSTAAYIVYSSL